MLKQLKNIKRVNEILENEFNEQKRSSATKTGPTNMTSKIFEKKGPRLPISGEMEKLCSPYLGTNVNYGRHRCFGWIGNQPTWIDGGVIWWIEPIWWLIWWLVWGSVWLRLTGWFDNWMRINWNRLMFKKAWKRRHNHPLMSQRNEQPHWPMVK